MSRTTPIQLALISLFLLGLPLAGVGLAGQPLGRYLEFPPRTQYVEHAPFSWSAFVLLLGLALALFAGFLWLLWPRGPRLRHANAPHRFPVWGWVALASLGLCWLLAWTRFDGFRALQPYTFTPLWLSYIVFVNALTFWRSGRSLLTHRTVFFLRLFPLSALFWWYFEYLNRFVQNWHYVGIEPFGPWQYTLNATLAFSTVLPAVIGTTDFLATFPRLGNVRTRPFWRLRDRRFPAWVALFVSGTALAGLGIWPDVLFPLVWVAPLFLILSLQALMGQATVFAPLATGRWRIVALPALAALICGLLWEMWNEYSLAKWIYTIPFVQRFAIFEMPVLGYTGYLPFGLECVAIVSLLDEGRRWAGEIDRTGTD